MLIHVDYSHQSVTMLTKEIKECTVLTEFIGIRGIVGRTVVITEQQNKTTSHQTAQRLTAGHISFL